MAVKKLFLQGCFLPPAALIHLKLIGKKGTRASYPDIYFSYYIYAKKDIWNFYGLPAIVGYPLTCMKGSCSSTRLGSYVWDSMFIGIVLEGEKLLHSQEGPYLPHFSRISHSVYKSCSYPFSIIRQSFTNTFWHSNITAQLMCYCNLCMLFL